MFGIQSCDIGISKTTCPWTLKSLFPHALQTLTVKVLHMKFLSISSILLSIKCVKISSTKLAASSCDFATLWSRFLNFLTITFISVVNLRGVEASLQLCSSLRIFKSDLQTSVWHDSLDGRSLESIEPHDMKSGISPTIVMFVNDTPLA